MRTSRERLLALLLVMSFVVAAFMFKSVILMANENAVEDDSVVGTRWVVLVAGSRDYANYRHQILRKSGVKEENIIAKHELNSRTGVIPKENAHIGSLMGGVKQSDVELLFLWERYKRSDGKDDKTKILNEIKQTIKLRNHLDSSVEFIGMLLFGPIKGPTIISAIRESGLPVVDDWKCLKSMVRLFETHCGSLTEYASKQMRAFANICNARVLQSAVEEATIAACSGYDSGQWHPTIIGYSA